MTLKPILMTGCYYIRYRPAVRDDNVDHFDGVLRVTREDADGNIVADDKPAEKICASADLYAHHRSPHDYPTEEGILNDYKNLKPAEKGIPFFPRSLYSHYLLASEVRENLPGARHVMI